MMFYFPGGGTSLDNAYMQQMCTTKLRYGGDGIYIPAKRDLLKMPSSARHVIDVLFITGQISWGGFHEELIKKQNFAFICIQY